MIRTVRCPDCLSDVEVMVSNSASGFYLYASCCSEELLWQSAERYPTGAEAIASLPTQEFPPGWVCWNCGDPEPPIFLCEAEWVCESCFRSLSGFPEDIPSQELHDGINEQKWTGYNERVKAVYFGEGEDPDITGIG